MATKTIKAPGRTPARMPRGARALKRRRSEVGKRLARAKVPARQGMLTKTEAYRLFDQAAQRYFSMSGGDFLRCWQSGEFDAVQDPIMHNKITYVAMLRPSTKVPQRDA